MKNIYRRVLAIATLAFSFLIAPAQLIINELMQSNIDCIRDDLNEFPDSWVELYNVGTASENLADYRLCDKNKYSKAYALPARQIAPGEFVVIYCDKAATGLHTDFRLDSGKGGSVYLFKNEDVADKVEEWKKQPAPNIAYGRQEDGDDKWGYQAVPTPGRANCGKTCKDVLGEPIFSVKGKVSQDNFSLSLTMPENTPEGAVIRYTLDGKEPGDYSPQYTSPIQITSTAVVRAKLFCDGYLSPRSTTHSYIHHPRAITLPVVSIVTDRAYFYDNKIGIYVKGTYDSQKPNYEYDWRRPVNIEYFAEAGVGSSINQLCETRVKGGATRGNALKSLAVYANKRFGTKRFEYEFFPSETPGVAEFKSFEMRNSGNDFDYMYMRDAIIQHSMGMHADIDWQPSQPVIFYLNGEYKGILNIRPRSNEDYVYSYYAGLEDIDLLENWDELKEGSRDNFEAFKAFYTATGHTFAEFDNLMDVSEFCNLMIMNIFFDNKDFPGNNIVMWRPQAEEGRWRWIAKDTDFGLGLYGERSNYPTLNWITTPGYDNDHNKWANQADHSRLFRRLLATPEFKDMFIDRAAIYLGNFLRADSINARIDKRYNEIKTEYKYHRDQINPWWPNYANEVTNAKRWANERWTFFYNHLSNYFGLKYPVTLTVDKGAGTSRQLVMNDVELAGHQYDGKFYPGRHLTIKSLSETDGLYVNGWEVKVTSASGVDTRIYSTESLSIDMPEGSKVEIKTILSATPSSIEDIEAGIDFARPVDIYDIAGRHLGSTPAAASLELHPGIYILRQGSVTQKIVIR